MFLSIPSHGCAYILFIFWWLLASSGLKLKAFASPGGKLPFRVPFLVPLLWYKGGSLSHLLKKSRRKIAPSLRFRGDCGRLPHSRRWITVEGGGVVRESCSAINRSAAPLAFWAVVGAAFCSKEWDLAAGGGGIAGSSNLRRRPLPICARLVISSPALRGGLAGWCGLPREKSKRAELCAVIQAGSCTPGVC